MADGAMTNDAFVVFDRVQKSYDGVTLVVKDLNLSLIHISEPTRRS